jgi:hypothetical protein
LSAASITLSEVTGGGALLEVILPRRAKLSQSGPVLWSRGMPTVRGAMIPAK